MPSGYLSVGRFKQDLERTISVYAPDWSRLRRKFSRLPSIPIDIDWESLLIEDEFVICVSAKLSSEGDIRECLELIDGMSIFPGGAPEGPPPPPRKYYHGGGDIFPDCSPRILIDIRPMVSAGWSKWDLRVYLRGYILKCENVVKSITLVGSASDMHTLDLTGKEGKGPTWNFNALVEGINTTRSRAPIAFRLIIINGDENEGKTICLM